MPRGRTPARPKGTSTSNTRKRATREQSEQSVSKEVATPAVKGRKRAKSSDRTQKTQEQSTENRSMEPQTKKLKVVGVVKDKRKLAKFKTAGGRAKEFSGEGFVAEGNSLRCQLCGVMLAWMHKGSLLRHIKTSRHKVEKQKLQEPTRPPPPLADGAVQTLRADIIKVFAACNIPLEKMDNPMMQLIFKKYSGKLTNYLLWSANIFFLQAWLLGVQTH